MLNQCLAILHSIKDDKQRLEKLLKLMQQEFLEEEEEEEEEVDKSGTVNHLARVPVKYRAIIKEIADNMSAQLVSFVDPETLEVDAFPLNNEYIDMDEEAFDIDMDNRIKVEPLESHDSFEIMENFVARLPSGKDKERLLDAIDGNKPFANFNRVIRESKFREDWFEFRQNELEKFVIDNFTDKIFTP